MFLAQRVTFGLLALLLWAASARADAISMYVNDVAAAACVKAPESCARARAFIGQVGWKAPARPVPVTLQPASLVGLRALPRRRQRLGGQGATCLKLGVVAAALVHWPTGQPGSLAWDVGTGSVFRRCKHSAGKGVWYGTMGCGHAPAQPPAARAGRTTSPYRLTQPQPPDCSSTSCACSATGTSCLMGLRWQASAGLRCAALPTVVALRMLCCARNNQRLDSVVKMFRRRPRALHCV